jgi:2-methylisocitrate lyase-like PEP mutase family enzyme
MPRTVAAKRAAFRALHESGCFMLPNPWDVGSARYLETLGFKALATTSSGFAWSKGHADNHVTRDAVLAHLREIVDATDLPVNADFESGFGATPDDVAQSVKLAVATGVAGLSIEDSTGDASAPLFPVDVAVARMKAARRAIDETGGDTLLSAARRIFSQASPISTTRSRVSKRMPMPARTASMRPASRRASTLRPW